jgi:hypothetical protein
MPVFYQKTPVFYLDVQFFGLGLEPSPIERTTPTDLKCPLSLGQKTRRASPRGLAQGPRGLVWPKGVILDLDFAHSPSAFRHKRFFSGGWRFNSNGLLDLSEPHRPCDPRASLKAAAPAALVPLPLPCCGRPLRPLRQTQTQRLQLRSSVSIWPLAGHVQCPCLSVPLFQGRTGRTDVFVWAN